MCIFKNLVEKLDAINLAKKTFTKNLYKQLNLTYIDSPLFFLRSDAINDPLNGEKPVTFQASDIEGDIEVVHSLAKWKRMTLGKLDLEKYSGIFCHMRAIRKEEFLSYKHSIYVDQWDWEMAIDVKDRNLDFLFSTVEKIWESVKASHKLLKEKYPSITHELADKLSFISSEELYDMFPTLTAEEREREYSKQHKAFFVYRIGYSLPDGQPHSKRSFDYDDWNLNGDLIVFDPQNDDALELCSMGIRVNADSLKKQQEYMQKEDSCLGEYHHKVYKGELPYTIGGGIGQSRMTMFLLGFKHIAEVQTSCWNKEIIDQLNKLDIDHWT